MDTEKYTSGCELPWIRKLNRLWFLDWLTFAHNAIAYERPFSFLGGKFIQKQMKQNENWEAT